MGKRKPQLNAASDTVSILDVVETNNSTDLAENNCQHVAKAVELNHVKKSLKAENLKILACTICCKAGVPPKKDEDWLCLQCGARQCCLEHLKTHFNVPRSDSHTVAFSLNNFSVWCELCKSYLKKDEPKKLKICIGYIKQMMDTSKQVQIIETTYNDDVPPPLVELNESNESESAKPNVVNRKNYYYQQSVHGLINLGNTCFFNSVLQCLARTPKLVETLRKMETEEEHIRITLNNGHQLEGALGRSSDLLGQCLADILVSLCRAGSTSPENPLKLLQLLRKKCPQFEGYDQHDSHELLRHLLDNVRQNDLKRYRALMLSELGLSRKVNPQDVSPELTKRVKALDNEVIDKVTLVPDHVFKGLLVSTLKCQECKNTSQCVESFLDLSLPIMADKPQPPSIRRKGSASPELVDEKVGGGLSKYQQKKQAKQARKKARNKHGQKSGVNAAGDGSLAPALDSHSDKGESEADVEDNEEDKPHESGYSSEKIQSESSSLSGGDDSARTSPTTHVQVQIKDERISVSSCTSITVCQGLPKAGCFSYAQSSGLIAQPHYEASPRIRRKPPPNWIGCGGSLTPAWIPHSDTTYIPNPQQIMEDGESWKSYVPREGMPPSSGRLQKDSLKPIDEESDSNNAGQTVQPWQTSVSHQVDFMSKVVETMLAQVHICQQDLDKYENQTVTEPSVSHFRSDGEGNVDCPRVCNSDDCGKGGDLDCSVTQRLCDRQSSSNLDKMNSYSEEISQIVSSNMDVNSWKDSNRLSPTWSKRNSLLINDNQCIDVKADDDMETTEKNSTGLRNYQESISKDKERRTNDSPRSDTSNGFHIDSLYNSRNGTNIEGGADQQKMDWDKDKELDVNPLLDCTEAGVKENNTIKKEDGECVRMRRRRVLDKEVCNRQESDSECSVQSCLSQFTAIEILSGANRVGCSACTLKHNKGNKDGKTINTIASKQLLIKKVPQVLILHLKRFQVQMYAFRKLSKHVSFPLYLDLAPFCLQEVERDEDGKIVYCLYGVVEHSGNLNGGHYVAYVKVDKEENSSQWFCISDSHIREVSVNVVLQSQAYLLFYKRIACHHDQSS